MILWLITAVLTAGAPAALEASTPPATDVYEGARPGDSQVACPDLKAAVEAIDAEILAQDEAYTEEGKQRFAVRGAVTQAYGAAAVASGVAGVPFSDAGLAAARTGIRAQQQATAAVAAADRQSVIIRQTEMRRRINHLTEIYFAKDCALTAGADAPK